MQKATVGRIVHYVPPQECVGPKSLTLYPAIVTEINTDDDGNEVGTVELATFGPNSLYFQHDVPWSEEYKPGHWSWMPWQKEQHQKTGRP